MTTLKCKMCGGELENTEETSVCECEYCGSKRTIPTVDDEEIMKLYFYDEFISTIINDKYSFKTTFNKTIKETEGINPDYNITMDSEILDNDGFPKYVQLLCDDSDGNSWNCCYYKVKDCNKDYYYPRDFEII